MEFVEDAELYFLYCGGTWECHEQLSNSCEVSRTLLRKYQKEMERAIKDENSEVDIDQSFHHIISDSGLDEVKRDPSHCSSSTDHSLSKLFHSVQKLEECSSSYNTSSYTKYDVKEVIEVQNLEIGADLGCSPSKSTEKGKKTFNCLWCSRPFRHKNSLNTHIQTQHSNLKPYQCEICGRKFKRKDYLKTHLRTHTSEKPFHCKVCGRGFSQKTNLNAHTKTHHNGMSENFTKHFYEYDKKKLSLSDELHGEKKDLNPSTSTNEMEAYSRQFLEEKGELKSVADSSDLITVLPSNFFEDEEFLNSTMIPSFVQPYSRIQNREADSSAKSDFDLEFNFKDKSANHGESSTHPDDSKPFICKYCGQCFGHKSSLNPHIKTQHIDKKPFECEICNRRFKRKDYLKTHFRTHTAEKPFQCQLCNKRFTQKTNLNAHMRLHADIKPYVCDLCGQRFNHKNNLKLHLAKKHYIQLPIKDAHFREAI